MPRMVTAIVLTALCSAAFAHGGVKNEAVMARMNLMTDIRNDMAVLGDMAKGKTAFERDRAETARAALERHALRIPTLFKAPASDPKSEAHPAIWENWENFGVKATAMAAAARAFDPQSLETLRAGIGALGGTCKACHESYRINN